jgi:hypothetical protein
VEFADGPSHLAGMHGELRRPEQDAQTIDAGPDAGLMFNVGASGWFRLNREVDSDSGTERLAEFDRGRQKLVFGYYDGALHVARSSRLDS